MKFFIDTANLDQIREAQALGILDGVTTNPSLMAKEGITGKDNIINHYKAICDIVDGHVSAEVISTDFEGMVKEGEEDWVCEQHQQQRPLCGRRKRQTEPAGTRSRDSGEAHGGSGDGSGDCSSCSSAMMSSTNPTPSCRPHTPPCSSGTRVCKPLWPRWSSGTPPSPPPAHRAPRRKARATSSCARSSPTPMVRFP